MLLFGVLKHASDYPDSVKVLGYHQKPIFKLLYLLRYWILLSVFRSGDKWRLDALLRAQGRSDLYTKVKCYPVLWHRPDVFHVQWAKGIKDWMWVQEFGMKLVLSLRGAHINYSPLADHGLAESYRKFFPKMDAFHAVSQAIGKVAEIYGARRQNMVTVYSGLDLNSFSFDPKSSVDGPIKLLSVGRPHWKKGYAYALDACFLLKQDAISFRYHIIGGFGDVELLYQRQDMGLIGEVQLEDNQVFESVKKQIQEADIVLMPSVEEGIPNVVLEAMAMGTVVIATDCGGMDEVLDDGVNGFLVPTRDTRALADKIKYVMGLPEDRLNAIRLEARNTIERQHSLEMMVEGMEALYRQVTMGN